MYNPLQKDTFF